MGEIEKIVEQEGAVQEEKPVDGGVPCEVVGVPEGEKKTQSEFVGYDADGRKYSTTRLGGKRYYCESPGCKLWSVKNSRRCRKHQEVGQGTTQNLSVMPELRMVRRFIKSFVADKTHNDPKIHVRLVDLEKSVQILSDKLAAGVTIEQLRQVGFYFGAILFQYITDGNRYEMAKKEFIENMVRVGCFSAADIEGMTNGARNSLQPTPVS